MGLWDYEEEVEAYVPGQASSSDSPSESGDSPTPRTKRGRKRKTAPAAAEAARPVVAIDDEDDNLLPDINVISDSDSDDLLEIKSTKATPESAAKSRGGRTPVGHASVEHPEEHLDKDTLQYLNHNQQLLKQLEDDDDEDDYQPGPSTAYRRTYHAAYVPQEDLSEADRIALASGPQAAASGSGAAPAGDAPDNDGGAKICLRLQAKARTIKMKINPHNPFSKLIDKYTQHARAQGWLAAGAAVRLVLDGDVVDPDDTPEAQGLEDDDIIEVQH